jgi:hypothetical protein
MPLSFPRSVCVLFGAKLKHYILLIYGGAGLSHFLPFTSFIIDNLKRLNPAYQCSYIRFIAYLKQLSYLPGTLN